jgi:hypothetical protein
MRRRLTETIADSLTAFLIGAAFELGRRAGRAMHPAPEDVLAAMHGSAKLRKQAKAQRHGAQA